MRSRGKILTLKRSRCSKGGKNVVAKEDSAVCHYDVSHLLRSRYKYIYEIGKLMTLHAHNRFLRRHSVISSSAKHCCQPLHSAYAALQTALALCKYWVKLPPCSLSILNCVTALWIFASPVISIGHRVSRSLSLPLYGKERSKIVSFWFKLNHWITRRIHIVNVPVSDKAAITIAWTGHPLPTVYNTCYSTGPNAWFLGQTQSAFFEFQIQRINARSSGSKALHVYTDPMNK